MKIALIGYGKMGRLIEEIAKSRGHEIVSVIDLNNQTDFESAAFRSAQVAIEFTNPTSAYDNCRRAWAQGVKVVSGSTGWMEKYEAEVRHACLAEGKTLFWASNFSLGVAIFSALNKYLATIMNRFPDYEVSMTETHHVHKLDAPSGTAITLAEQIVERIDRKARWAKGELREINDSMGVSLAAGGTAHELPADTMRIDSVRRGEVPGIHTIVYDSPADSITITHDAHSRRGFALGAVLAAEFTSQRSGLLTSEDLFNF